MDAQEQILIEGRGGAGVLSRAEVYELVGAAAYAGAVARGAVPEKPRRDHAQLLLIHKLADLLGVDALDLLQKN